MIMWTGHSCNVHHDHIQFVLNIGNIRLLSIHKGQLRLKELSSIQVISWPQDGARWKVRGSQLLRLKTWICVPNFMAILVLCIGTFFFRPQALVLHQCYRVSDRHHGNALHSCRDISVWTKVVDQITVMPPTWHKKLNSCSLLKINA